MNERKVYQLTRNTGFLWKSSAALAAALLALGCVIGLLNTSRQDLFQELIASPRVHDEFMEGVQGARFGAIPAEKMGSVIHECLTTDRAFHENLATIAALLRDFHSDGPIVIPPTEHLESTQRAIAEGLVAACEAPDDETAWRPLEALALTDPAPIDANYALALAFENRDDNPAALVALAREIDAHDSDPARARQVDVYFDLEDYAALRALTADPHYKAFFTPFALQKIAREQGDWPMILKTHFAAAYEGVDPAMVALALLSGLVWAVLVIRFNGSFRGVWPFLAPALVLGAFSAHATLMVIYWQEHQLGLTFGADTVGQIVYCLGIGLREEGLKLLLFVPLIPFLLRRDDLEVLTVAGLVGLGFALEENINYFEASAGLSAVARFATANFLHIALTAMCGLTLTRAIAHRGEDSRHFGGTFVIAVVIHGAYDAFLMVPALLDYSWLSQTVFVLMGYQYFGWLRHLRDQWMDPISVTAIFTYGVILVTGLSFGLYAWRAGPAPALQAIVSEAIGVAIILFLFYREIPETLD